MINNFESDNHYMLVIETSVSGGSLSIMRRNNVIDCWEGSGSVSKAEDVLEAISILLTKNQLTKHLIKQIVVSKGPGSFTGIRIGMAISLGLQRSLECDIYGLSVLESMANQFKELTEFVTVIPVGDRQVCFQSFEVNKNNKLLSQTNPTLLFLDSFLTFMQNKPDKIFILQKVLFENVLKMAQKESILSKNILCSPYNLSYLIGKNFNENGTDDNLQPIYSMALLS